MVSLGDFRDAVPVALGSLWGLPFAGGRCGAA